MAKQSGIHQIKGKVGKMSYYRQKGVTDGLARSINEGLSNRVKTAEEYENTRLNAAEFGSAASFAGACIRSISERKRAMLKNFATGDCAKFVREIILADGTHNWGDRQLVGTDWQDGLRQRLNQYAKLPYSEYMGGLVNCNVTRDGVNLDVSTVLTLPADWGQMFIAKGATNVLVDVYLGGNALNVSGNAPYKGDSISFSCGEVSEQIGAAGPIEIEGTIVDAPTPADMDNIAAFALVVVKPFKTINGKMHILQELCTYTIVKPSVTE